MKKPKIRYVKSARPKKSAEACRILDHVSFWLYSQVQLKLQPIPPSTVPNQTSVDNSVDYEAMFAEF